MLPYDLMGREEWFHRVFGERGFYSNTGSYGMDIPWTKEEIREFV